MGVETGETVGLECQAHQMYWNGRGRSRVRTSRCIADDVRRGMAGLEAPSLAAGGAGCDKLGLRDLDRLSSVAERECEGIEPSRVGKLLLVDMLATEVIMADGEDVVVANGEARIQLK